MSLDAGSCLLAAAGCVVAAGIPALFWLIRLPRPVRPRPRRAGAEPAARASLRAGRGRTAAGVAAPGARHGAALLAAAVITTMVWVSLAAWAAVLLADPVEFRRGLAVIGSIGVALAALLTLAGIERLPGAVESRPARLRRRVDAFLITAATLMGGWIVAGLVFNHAKPVRVHPLWDAFVITPPLVAALGTLAFALVTIVRVARPWVAVSLLSAASVLMVGGSAGTVSAILYGTPDEVGLAGVATAAGVLLMGGACVGRLRGQLNSERVNRKHGWYLSGIVVLGAFATVVVQLSFAQVLDRVALIAGVTTGVTLVIRQWIALHDAGRLAAQLSADEISLRVLAFTDPLTGLANRRELMRVLNEEAVGGAACVLLAIDLDGFKNVNDLRGHDVGDAVLAEVSRRLRTNLRDGDVAARMGGDEFAVLMWAGLADATVAARRLRAVLAQPIETAAGSVYVSASIGVAGCGSANDVPQLLGNADMALRFAKQRGKNRVELYDVAYDGWLHRRTQIEHELRGAIARDEFELAYQPVIELSSMRIVGVEALLRWDNPTLGSVRPDEFIPIAEDAGMIGQLDRWVLHRACRQVGRWRSDGHDVWISVNISVRELHLVDYVAHVTDVLRAHRLPADRLVLEITEHAVAVDLEELVSKLEALRATGVRIALDDFGAGYSSLGRLRWLPVDILKIDRSLVGDPRGVPSRSAAPLVDVVVSLGQRLGLSVIAEGVAEPAELAVVRRSGATLIQGEMLGRAMPAERVEAMLSGSISFDDGSRAGDQQVPGPRVHDVGRLDSGREMRQS